MSSKVRLYFLILFLAGITQCVRGQYDQRPSSTLLTLDSSAEDTIGVQYFTLKDTRQLIKVSEPNLSRFEQFAGFRRFESAALILGNLGSSNLPVMYSPRTEIWKDPGFHQYDLHKLKREDLKFFKIGSPYNNLSFSPAGSQDNFKVGAEFSTNFQDNVNLSLDYERINQSGIYSEQNTKQTSLGIGVWKNNIANKHKIFFTFLANNHNENQNGGIIFEPRPFRQRSSEPSFLNEADTRHQNFSYAIDNFKVLGSKAIEAHHQLHYHHGYYRYSDVNANTANDTLIYSDFITDDRGIRYFLGFRKLRNTLDLSFNWKSIDVNVGMVHQYARFVDFLRTDKFHELYGLGNFKFKLKDKFLMQVDAKIGMGKNVGNLFFSPQLSISPINGINIQGSLDIRRYDASIIDERLVLTQALIYENAFRKINDFSFGAKLSVDALNLKVGIKSGIIDNAIASDTFSLPIQYNNSIEYLQATIEHKFKWRFIGIENQLLYQTFSENIFRLPELYGIHNVFLEFHVFKKNLLLRLGGIYYSQKLGGGLAFMPVTGRFYPSNTDNLDYTYYEAYASFQIKTFRLFVKMQNLNDMFIPAEHYHINNYPQNDRRLRLGVNWLFRG